MGSLWTGGMRTPIYCSSQPALVFLLPAYGSVVVVWILSGLGSLGGGAVSKVFLAQVISERGLRLSGSLFSYNQSGRHRKGG